MAWSIMKGEIDMIILQLELDEALVPYLIEDGTEGFWSASGIPGVYYRFRFPENNYGASVVKNFGSYGYDENLWELALIHFDGDVSHLEYTELVVLFICLVVCCLGG